MKYKRVLSIAGSDSGGGAGIQADIKTISACGCYAATAITAVTVQNTVGVEAVAPVPTDIIEGQIEAVLSDIGADAVKIGMLHSAEVVEVVCRVLDRYKPKNIVIDPVMVSTSGHRLIDESAIDILKERLLPRATIITPNIPEAEILLGEKIGGQKELPEAARRLGEQFGCAVLLKAGHLSDDLLTDIFWEVGGSTRHLQSERLDTRNTHGTGCTLSAAVAAYLAQGLEPSRAVTSAKDYLTAALKSGARFSIGEGHGPVDHLFSMRR